MVGTEGSLKTVRQPLEDSAGANMCFHVLGEAKAEADTKPAMSLSLKPYCPLRLFICL